MPGRVVVGMSGGVDSSVAAYLLQQAGWDVLGVFMINWEDDSADPQYRNNLLSGCVWEQDFADVRRVCDQLGIPYTTMNFVAEYRDLVFNQFLEELKVGRTPNPDILCNQEIKFHLFAERALQLPGVTHVATGHYAKVQGGKLYRPADHNKDQTYFLHRVPRAILPQVLFPLSDYTKDQVRQIATDQNLVTATKKDSTGICFIGDVNYSQFVQQYLPANPGQIQDHTGQVLGEHQGLHLFTIGQRHGINIGGTGPYYVVQKDTDRNVLIVTNNPDDPALFCRQFIAGDLHWLVDVDLPIMCQVQVRYRQDAVAARLTQVGDAVSVQFDSPQRAVTPGQSAVFYAGDCVLGGGVIE